MLRRRRVGAAPPSHYADYRTQLGGPSGLGYKAEPVDIWGMGVVLYTMLCGSEHAYRSSKYC